MTISRHINCGSDDVWDVTNTGIIRSSSPVNSNTITAAEKVWVVPAAIAAEPAAQRQIRVGCADTYMRDNIPMTAYMGANAMGRFPTTTTISPSQRPKAAPTASTGTNKPLGTGIEMENRVNQY